VAKNPLFSTYKQGENRVTSSMLAVFERIDLSLLETILQEASGESALQMVSFLNQPPGKGHSVPDALISARFAYYFEVKTARNAVSANQLSEHCGGTPELRDRSPLSRDLASEASWIRALQSGAELRRYGRYPARRAGGCSVGARRYW
jgi:hypothetical protein